MEPKAVLEGNILVWDIGTLPALQERRFELQLLPEARGEVACQATVTFTGSSTTRLTVHEPKLMLKASTPDKVLLGDVTTIALTVSNPGDGAAEHVKVRAMLPESSDNAQGRTGEFDLGNLAPNEIRTLQLLCTPRSEGMQRCEITATADGDLTAREAAVLDVIIPRLELRLSGPKLRYLDRHATYVLKVVNPCSVAMTNVALSEQLPQGFKFVEASDNGHYDVGTQTVSWALGDLPAGQAREINFKVVAISPGDFKHKASVNASRCNTAEAQMMTHVEGLSTLLMELTDLDDPVEVGTDTAYEIRVTNTGSKTETNLQLTCTVPDKMECRGARGPAGCQHHVEGKEVIFDPLPRLAPRADAIYRVNVRGIAPGDLRFRARIKSDSLTDPLLKEENTKVYGDEALPR